MTDIKVIEKDIWAPSEEEILRTQTLGLSLTRKQAISFFREAWKDHKRDTVKEEFDGEQDFANDEWRDAKEEDKDATPGFKEWYECEYGYPATIAEYIRVNQESIKREFHSLVEDGIFEIGDYFEEVS